LDSEEDLDDGETEYLDDVVAKYNSLHNQTEVLVEQPDDGDIHPDVIAWMMAQPDITGLVGAWLPPVGRVSWLAPTSVRRNFGKVCVVSCALQKVRTIV
jgi:hypothetical protein